MAVDSLVSGGCIVSGATVRRSILFNGVAVAEGSLVEDSVVLMAGKGHPRLPQAPRPRVDAVGRALQPTRRPRVTVMVTRSGLLLAPMN
jgi:ADP-glucose pyrophosphorylase